MTDEPCPRCGQHHPRCRAHNRAGRPCGLTPQPGQRVCHLHGGASPQALASADARLELERRQQALADGLALAFGDNPPPIAAADAMIFAVSAKHAEVLWLRAKVATLTEDDLTWGTTKVKSGGDDRGTTQEAKPNIWWTMLRTAEDQLVKFAAAARAAGCDEARVQLAKQQGDIVAVAIRRILDALTLSPAQLDLVPTVVPGVLRAIAGGDA